MLIDKLNKTFVSEQVLKAEELNLITGKVDEIIDNIPVVDSELSSKSENPVQNKAITGKLTELSEDASVKDYDILVDWIRGCLDGTYKNRVDEVKAKVLAKIDVYDKSENVNSFILDGQNMWLDKSTRVGLMNSTNIEKEARYENTTLWFGGQSYTIPCETAIQMLSSLELYALNCYNVTAQHKSSVEAMETVEELESYDYTEGYPEKLVFSTTA